MKYGYGSSARSRGLESDLGGQEDAATLTTDGVDIRIDIGQGRSVSSEAEGITVERELFQNIQPRNDQ